MFVLSVVVWIMLILVRLWIIKTVDRTRTIFFTQLTGGRIAIIFSVSRVQVFFVFTKGISKRSDYAVGSETWLFGFSSSVICYRKHRLQRVGQRTCGWNPNGQSGSDTLGILFLSLLLSTSAMCFFGYLAFADQSKSGNGYENKLFREWPVIFNSAPLQLI